MRTRTSTGFPEVRPLESSPEPLEQPPNLPPYLEGVQMAATV